MSWIVNRKGEDIPKELYYEGWQTDKDKDIFTQTPLMLWIDYR